MAHTASTCPGPDCPDCLPRDLPDDFVTLSDYLTARRAATTQRSRAEAAEARADRLNEIVKGCANLTLRLADAEARAEALAVQLAEASAVQLAEAEALADAAEARAEALADAAEARADVRAAMFRERDLRSRLSLAISMRKGQSERATGCEARAEALAVKLAEAEALALHLAGDGAQMAEGVARVAVENAELLDRLDAAEADARRLEIRAENAHGSAFRLELREARALLVAASLAEALGALLNGRAEIERARAVLSEYHRQIAISL
jgi:hypothetical protein